MTPAYTIFFKEISKDDTPTVGGKGANLGEMTGINLPIPPGFVVTAGAYKHFLKINNLQPTIEKILKTADINNHENLSEISKQIKSLIVNSPMPPDLSVHIIQSYKKLSKELDNNHLQNIIKKLFAGNIPVAVRSSATSEDSKDASFAGQNETYLNVSGEKNLVNSVRNCYASLFDGRSIFYREQNGFDHFKSAIAVVVQVMVQSDISGIMFSIDPVTNNKNRIVIEAIYGLGEYIVQGKITPDHYEINKSDLRLVEKMAVTQKVMLTRGKTGSPVQKNVSKSKQSQFKLSDAQVKALANYSLKLEKHYYFPQDSEFAISHGKIYLVQTRPVTTTGKLAQKQVKEGSLKDKKVLLIGAPASPGIVSGKVTILKNADELGKISVGDILVAPQTNPDFVPAMKKATAIVTDSGGRTSHAAIVSRELGIPCVVGTSKATKVLKNGEIVTVDGSEGKVYEGAVEFNTTKIKIKNESKLKTKTKIYVNLAEPEKAKEIAALNCDGVGLLRAEFMLAGIGIHPKEVIARGQQTDYITKLAKGLTEFASAFYPRPVIYRATDFKTNEYKTLIGGQKYEPHEENPMIGFRGAYRYLIQPEVFNMELAAIAKVRQTFDNLHLMIPFCRTVKELEKIKYIVNKSGLRRSQNFHFWMMCEIPANVILLDKFIEVGLDGISVGSNDLTMLTLGVDRDNENVAPEYSELDDAVLDSFYKIIKTCQKYNVTCSMCGQAPSDYPYLAQKLVEWGITSLSINPDALDQTRQAIFEAEKKTD